MRRSKFEQAVAILSYAMQPIGITNLFSKANVSQIQIQPVFRFLTEKGFLERVDPLKIRYPGYKKHDRTVKFLYRNTQKGLAVLRILKTEPLYELLGCHEWIREQKEGEG